MRGVFLINCKNVHNLSLNCLNQGNASLVPPTMPRPTRRPGIGQNIHFGTPANPWDEAVPRHCTYGGRLTRRIRS